MGTPSQFQTIKHLSAAWTVGNSITAEEVESLIGKINELDGVLKSRLGLNFLSSEGAVLCSLIGNSGMMTKSVTTNCNYSERTAFNVIRKLESMGLVKKGSHRTDSRRSEVRFQINHIVNLINSAS